MNDLVRVIRSEVDLSQVAAHVRNECRSNMAIQQAFDVIEFVIDGPPELPSPTQLLNPLAIPEEMIDTEPQFADRSSDTGSRMFTGEPSVSRP